MHILSNRRDYGYGYEPVSRAIGIAAMEVIEAASRSAQNGDNLKVASRYEVRVLQEDRAGDAHRRPGG